MIYIIANSEFKAIVNSELELDDNEAMRYKDYADRFRSIWMESSAPKVQKDLAKWLGVSQPTVSDWLNGVKLPSMDRAIKLGERFDCNVEWLLTGKGPKRIGNEVSSAIYQEIIKLSIEQQKQIKSYTAFVASQVHENNTNQDKKPLTTPDVNVGGGGCAVIDECVDRRALERRVEIEVQKKSALTWPELRQTFYVKHIHQDDEDEQQPTQYE